MCYQVQRQIFTSALTFEILPLAGMKNYILPFTGQKNGSGSPAPIYLFCSQLQCLIIKVDLFFYACYPLSGHFLQSIENGNATGLISRTVSESPCRIRTSLQDTKQVTPYGMPLQDKNGLAGHGTDHAARKASAG